MSNTINADDGIISGIAGLKYSADTSGALVLQTNGTTAITISASQVVTFAGAVSLGALTTSGNLTFTGTGNRIIGDMTNGTLTSRLSFQTSTANSNTSVTALPNGTGAQGAFNAFNNADPTNAAYVQINANAGSAALNSGITGTGTYLPLTMSTGGSERMRIDTSGNVGIGTSSAGTILQIGNPSDSNQALRFDFSDSSTARINSTRVGAGNLQSLLLAGQDTMQFQTAGTERMRIDSKGWVGIGGGYNAITNLQGRVNISANSGALSDSTGIIAAPTTTESFLVAMGQDGAALRLTTYAGGTNWWNPRTYAGTLASPTAVGANTYIWSVSAAAYNGVGYVGAQRFGVRTFNAQTATDSSSYWFFQTTASGATGSRDVIYVKDSGNLEFQVADAGIKFNKTGALVSSTLNDYEEGTWTPVLGSTGTQPTVSYSIQTGYYRKVGSLVYVSGIILLTSISGGGGNMAFTGLPFTVANLSQNFPVGAIGQMYGFTSSLGDTDGQIIILRGNQNTTSLNIYESNETTGADWNVSQIGSSFLARFTISYISAN